MIARWAIRLAIRNEAKDILENGAPEDQLQDLRISTTTSLHGHAEAMQRWGASSPEACRRAQQRVREQGLVDGALYLSVLYTTGLDAPPPIYMSGGSGLDGPPGSGLAWCPSSGIDPTIKVKRFPDPVQEELWDSDGVAWTYWSAMRASEE